MKFIGIIPARFASSRFPGKPLALIQDKPMIQHVYEKANNCGILEKVYVATDDQRIFDAVTEFNGKVFMTSNTHKSGTERCNEIANMLLSRKEVSENDVIINIQGDEPMIHPDQIEKFGNLFRDKNVVIATLRKAITEAEELYNQNVVKVVVDDKGKALYFSRQAIPFIRNEDLDKWCYTGLFYKHIGIYAYRIHTLNKITRLPAGILENAEGLEQLRWIENAYTIHTTVTEIESVSIDTPDDLEKLNLIFK